jgi:hypothetical protein
MTRHVGMTWHVVLDGRDKGCRAGKSGLVEACHLGWANARHVEACRVGLIRTAQACRMEMAGTDWTGLVILGWHAVERRAGLTWRVLACRAGACRVGRNSRGGVRVGLVKTIEAAGQGRACHRGKD